MAVTTHIKFGDNLTVTDEGSGVIRVDSGAGSGGGTPPDATTSSKGIVQLAGDLAGTASAPTVPTKVDKDSVVVAATRLVASKLLAGDTQPAFQILGDGKHQWGPGDVSALDTNLYRAAADSLQTDDTFRSALEVYARIGTAYQVALGYHPSTNQPSVVFGNAGDTNLYRSAADTLQTDDSLFALLFRANPSAAGNTAFYSKVGAETQFRFLIQGDGKIEWGDGTTLRDTNLYRAAANTLKTDDVFHSAAYIGANVGAAGQTSIGDIGPASQAGIAFGSAADTNLYRSAADTLRSDDNFFASTLRATMNSGTTFTTWPTANALPYWQVNGADGKMFWGDGTAVGDTNLYRAAADRLKTDDHFDATTMGLATRAKAGAPADADWAVAPPVGTIVLDTTNSKLWVRTAAATWKGVVIA